MASKPCSQFDEDFVLLTKADMANIEYWNDVSDAVTETVDKVLSKRNEIDMVEKLDVSQLEISQLFPDIKSQLEYKLNKKAQSDEEKLKTYVSIFRLQTNHIILLSAECSRSSYSFPFSVRGEPSKILQNTKVEVSMPVTNLFSRTNKKITGMLVSRAEQLQQSKCMAMLYRKTLDSMLGWLEGKETDKMVWNVGEILK